VIAYDIKNDRETMSVARVNESLEISWSTITTLNSIRIDAIIAPIAFPWKLRYRHKLDGC
jgi:hypothetical protein